MSGRESGEVIGDGAMEWLYAAVYGSVELTVLVFSIARFSTVRRMPFVG